MIDPLLLADAAWFGFWWALFEAVWCFWRWMDEITEAP